MVVGYFVVLFLTSAFGVWTFRRNSAPIRLLIVLLVYTFIHEILVHYVIRDRNGSVMLYRLYATVSVLVYTLIFALWYERSRRIFHWAVMILMIAILTVSWFRMSGGNTFPSRFISLTHPLLLLMSIHLFYHILHTRLDLPLKRRSSFWFNVLFLIFISVTFVHLSLFEIQVSVNLNISRSLTFYIHTAVNLAFYLLLSVPIYIDSKYKEQR